MAGTEQLPGQLRNMVAHQLEKVMYQMERKAGNGLRHSNGETAPTYTLLGDHTVV